jgi:exonuclease III
MSKPISAGQEPGESAAIKILFWNTNRKNLDESICTLASDLGVDVILLAEYPSGPACLLSSLRADVDSRFFAPQHIKDKFLCISNDIRLSLNELVSEPRFSMRRFIHDSHSAILVTIHGVDPINHDIDHRNGQAQVIMAQLKSLSSTYKTQRLVIIGDFNVNPFDKCMTLPMAYNSVMTRECAKQDARGYQFEEYDFFYNPMWSLFGDLSTGPSGTYYYTGNRGMYGWNMLDQVMLHHSLAEYLDSVRIVDSTMNLNLADARGRPNAKAYSDHFPILITLKRNLP